MLHAIFGEDLAQKFKVFANKQASISFSIKGKVNGDAWSKLSLSFKSAVGKCAVFQLHNLMA